ncbi:energy-coupling factor transporter transmembrane protein EcfT [Synergistales bacterium]|nr:energy-coupling factor transporter transmembrane protein EcfT [Synergistales bacterium]
MKLFSGISLGQFIPGDSFIHNLDPRCKIICVFSIIGGLFAASRVADFIMWAALLLVICGLSRVSVRVVIRSARPVIFLMLITVLLNLFLTPGRDMARIGFLRITYEGVYLASEMGLRLFFLVVFASMLMMTTSPMSFSDGTERLLSPLAVVGFPASEMAMMMTIALRFIPTLLEETDRILKAQISRGVDFESGGLLKRARSFIPVLIPLFILVFQRAENLAVAMESRCYVPGRKRARLSALKWSRADTLTLAAVIAVITAIIVIDRNIDSILHLISL